MPQPTGTAGQARAFSLPAAPKGLLAITNAKIVPVTRPTIDRGTILVRDGLIESVGVNVSIPSGTAVIDAAGAEVYPGFIDAQTTMGLDDPGAGNFGDANDANGGAYGANDVDDATHANGERVAPVVPFVSARPRRRTVPACPLPGCGCTSSSAFATGIAFQVAR